MHLFSQRGFRGTTTKEIASASGVSEAMVFRHFATKEELYSAILDHKACLHDSMDPEQLVAEAIARKDDTAVFEGLALDALNHHDCDPEFHRLLLHSALEEHELAHMFWEKFVCVSPGLMTSTSIPSFASSALKASLNPCTANLLAEYSLRAGMPGIPGRLRELRLHRRRAAEPPDACPRPLAPLPTPAIIGS